MRDLLVICAAACLVMAFAARPARSQNVSFENEKWDAIYRGDKMPQAPWFYAPNGAAAAKVEDGALLISDLGTTNGERVLVNYLWRLSPEDELTVAANVKVKSCSGVAGNCILIANGVCEELITLYPDKVVLEHSKLSHSIDTTRDYRTYRVLVKGSDYTEDQVVGAPEVRSWGGEVVLVPLVEGPSTTGIVSRIVERAGGRVGRGRAARVCEDD